MRPSLVDVERETAVGKRGSLLRSSDLTKRFRFKLSKNIKQTAVINITRQHML